VILATQTEHNSVLRPLYNQKAARVRIVPCDERGFVAPEQVARSITPDVRAIFVNHVGNVTGAIQDAAAMGKSPAPAASRTFWICLRARAAFRCIPSVGTPPARFSPATRR
jgi:cysteine sulfinate desulfinase/cysteine desulfurase-like protein